MIEKIIKRDGRKVDFQVKLITQAIDKAFLSESVSNPEQVSRLTNLVVGSLEERCQDFLQGQHLDVETIQDVVEDILIREGYHKVAKKYIVYREQHKRDRQENVLSKIQHSKLKIVLPNQSLKIYNVLEFREKLACLSEGLSKVSVDSVLSTVNQNIYDKISFKDFQQVVTNASREKIEQHYQYSYLSARILLDKLYVQILSTELFSAQSEVLYRQKFIDYIKKGIDLDMLSPELATFDLQRISEAIVPQRDQLFLYLGLQILEDRYLLKERDLEHLIYELPQWMWMRVALGLAQKEKPEKKDQYAITFYNLLSKMDVISSTPTLFNSGTTHSQMSSCYINTVEDSLTGIFKTYQDNAQLSKWAGGIGTDWTSVRSTGSTIHGTNGLSQGVIPFINIFNAVALAVNQGGKRKGAMAAYLEVWHRDIEQFYELRKNTGDERRRAHDINTACWIPDLFMKRVQANLHWTLFSPSDVPDLHDRYGKDFEKAYEEYEKKGMPSAKRLQAVDLWRKHLSMLYETGHPWVTFKDPINVRNPQDHCGRIHSSNLCTEITLNTSQDETAVCNLASLNLAHMIVDGSIDKKKLGETVELAIRMLDNVIDNNFYPISEAKNSNFRHRPIGLGLMGYQDALYLCGIDFDSEENLVFADFSMELISYHAILGSSKLAKEKEHYESYRGSKWDRGIFPYDTLELLEKERGEKISVDRTQRLDWVPVKDHVRRYGMRNSNILAIAPTATIANIAGVTPCTEPTYKHIYMKENLSGNFVLVNRHLIDELEKMSLWNQDILNEIKLRNGSLQNIESIPLDIQRKYKEIFEIDVSWILQVAARRSKWIDQSSSTNIFIKTTSGKVLSELYTEAWRLGLKTTYYLRNQGASQVEKMIPVDQKNAKSFQEESLLACSLVDSECEVCQ